MIYKHTQLSHLLGKGTYVAQDKKSTMQIMTPVAMFSIGPSLI